MSSDARVVGAVPPVRRLVMYRHGVAYVERRGPAAGSFEVSFERDEMNDVLKSLSVWVVAGDARVGAVVFDAPDDPEQALEERNLGFDPKQVATGLLTALRGRRVTFHRGGKTLSGEVLGLEVNPGGQEPPRRQAVVRTDEGTVELVDLASVERVGLDEGPSRADLSFLVDRSRAASAGTSRSVTVDLTGAATELAMSYVVPSPVWRVSYRLMLVDDEATLMAWAIVHNPVDDELDAIELVLTTGQPVSFVIDLYQPKRIERAVVEETSRAGAAPTPFERAPSRRARAAARPQMMPAPAAAPPAPAGGGVAMDAMAAAEMASGMSGLAEGAAVGDDRGEQFEFRLQTPLSLKRGGSAMVPLATASPQAKKERIWRAGSGPNPDLVVRFDNDTSMVLEEGPVVVYEDGTYAGEAMVPYSARGVEVRLGYAKDLSVRCRHDARHTSELSSLRFGKEMVVQEHRDTRAHEIRADNEHDEPVTVLVELPKVHGRELDADAPEPLEETASWYRFALEIPASGTATLRVADHGKHHQHVAYDRLAGSLLASWLRKRLLDDATYEALSGVVEAWERAEELQRLRQSREVELEAHYEKQSRLSQQLGVLKDTGDEGALRLRYAKELAEEQDRINAIGEEMKRLTREVEEHRELGWERLAELTRDAG